MAVINAIGNYADDAWRAAKMYLKGFKKVSLNDTKGVLNRSNNFHWVKNSTYGSREFKYPMETRVLPSGTTIFTSDWHKLVYKPNGTYTSVSSWIDDDVLLIQGEYTKKRSLKNFAFNIGNTVQSRKRVTPLAVAQKRLEEVKQAAEKLTQKRLKFIEDFNAKYDKKVIVGENGQKTKIISDKKTGKTVSWWRRNEKGEVTEGVKVPDLLGKETIIKQNDMIAVKNEDLFGGINVTKINKKDKVIEQHISPELEEWYLYKSLGRF